MAVALAGMSATAVPAVAQIESGQMSAGVSAGYVSHTKSPAVSADFSYAFSKRFVLAPSLTYVFPNNEKEAVMFNLDYHGPWQLDKSGHWYVYHIIGVNFASWKKTETVTVRDDVDAKAETRKESVRQNRVGLDFGAGLAWYCRPDLKISLEGKLNWIKNNNTGIFTLGVSYVF